MIPKIIHYCWFGNNPLPKLERKCIKSWGKHCKNYKIIKWDESNFDVNSYTFTKEAYKSKKWAFVADFVRLYALTKYGGIYLDTDIELLKPLDDLLGYKGFIGFEDNKLINAAIMGCESDNESFLQFYNYYYNMSLNGKDGSIKMVSIPAILTSVCSSMGIKINNKLQEKENIVVFPNDYFYPKDYGTGITEVTKNTYSIHHYSASWFDPKSKRELKKSWRKNKIKKVLISIFGAKLFYCFRRKKPNIK